MMGKRRTLEECFARAHLTMYVDVGICDVDYL